MKRQIKLYILLALLGLVMSAPVYAGGWFFGAKTGTVIVDDSFVSSHPSNIGFLVGYDLDIAVGDIALEGEITRTTSKGELDNGSKFSADTQAMYLAFRSAGPVYFKAKGGFLQVDNDGNTDTGSSYGIGLGFGLGIMQLELELTKTAVDPDILFASVGIQF
jgi:hypothetical protein